MFYGWGEFLNGYYRKKSQRSIAEYHVKEDSKLAFLRQSYSGPYKSYMITEKKSEEESNATQLKCLNSCVRRHYVSKMAKFNDLQIMKQFCSPAAQEYYTKLPVKGNEE
ncbi:hypothetical protein ANN_01084 [Periplaneta americana]|uniref:Uncharacterized protein n=1 Tax=Periplaneta americana TaxID=6978 RepID=A0ABQ8TSM8_PERAM|nr:hypothetical protein ANN_01084 [Periplaneta americana]